MSRVSASLLRQLRNDIPIDEVIGVHLGVPAKHRDGVFRFLCPLCNEFNTATNPTTNLARCFRCTKNFNPIDLVMVVRRCPFLEAVRLLETIRAPPP
jgi:DNA primase